LSFTYRLKRRAHEVRKRLREKGNERITFLVIPHNDKAIVNMQLSNYVLALGIFSLIFVVVASVFAVNMQRNIQSEADKLQDRDRAYINERELYVRKYHEMTVQQNLFKKQFTKVIRQAKLLEGDEEIFIDEDILHDSAVQLLDAEGEEYARSLSYKENRTIKFLNFETTLKIAEGKSQEEGFYFYPEVALYRKLKLDMKQTVGAVVMLQQLLREREVVQQALPYYWPLAGGHFTSFFGGRISPFGSARDFHTGVDLADAIGTPIYAAADGRVVSCGFSGGYGLSLKIAHSYGFQTLYGHMSSLYATCGSYVKKGQIIGRVGATGRATGPHLHYEVRIMDHPVNPMPYLTSG
jgi:murein DD-endopeptidase MepM/ murein hydrolase activator NlpD